MLNCEQDEDSHYQGEGSEVNNFNLEECFDLSNLSSENLDLLTNNSESTHSQSVSSISLDCVDELTGDQMIETISDETYDMVQTAIKQHYSRAITKHKKE